MENPAVQTPAADPVYTSSPSPTPTDNSIPHHHKKWLYILAAAVMLMLGALGALVYQNWQLNQQLAQREGIPTQEGTEDDKTAGWQTYNGEGFSFKYPPTLVFSSSPDYDYVYYLETQNYQPQTNGSYQIQITATPNNQGIPEVLPALDTHTPEGTFTDQRAFVNFNDARGIVTTYKEEWTNNKRYTLFSHDLKIDFFGTGVDHSTLDQILATFEFTQKNTVQNTKPCTVSVQNFGFTLTIPSTWSCEDRSVISNQLIQLNIAGDEMTMLISNGGRDQYCIEGGPLGSEGCAVTSFYKTSTFDSSLYKMNGENKELWGIFTTARFPGENMLSISIKWNNMEQRDLSASEKSQIIEMINSFKITQ